uniref:Short-chain collagen C4-like n=1 Tax=Crassostrea virginica TaxID=6565 RepID=A0A8B8BR95_CRAVI|nr:short-chain collagen C4-like [Crassostrea virginica]
MVTWLVNLTWLCLVSNCRSDDTDIRTMDRRLLLNDPNTLLNHIEALQQEMTALKSQVTTLNTEVTTLNTEVTTLNTFKTEVTTQRTEIEALQNKLKTINHGTGSVYTVWGKKSCPAVNGTTTLYTGITGGNAYDNHGGGVNTLCLPHNPDNAPHDFPIRQGSSSYIYGSEYQFNYRKFALDDDVPCAVCHVNTATSLIMIPAKSTCPAGWTMQYHGFLVSDANISGFLLFDYVCLHNDAEYLTEGSRQHDQNGHILYPVQAGCGSLPCPPYKNDQYITCVVCTL